MKARPIEILLVLVLTATAVFLGYRHFIVEPPTQAPVAKAKRDAAATEKRTTFFNRTDLLLYFKNQERAEIFGELTPEQRDVLIALVKGHCGQNYDADSCVHYVIVCGRPCLAHITNIERARMASHYQLRRKQLGLPELE